MVVVGAGISSTTATTESSFCCFEKNKIVQHSGTKKAPKLNFLGKFCRQKSLLKFWPMGRQKKV